MSMKVLKKSVFLLLLSLIFIAWCSNSTNESITAIDSETRVSEDGLSADIIFSQQLQNTNYLSDLENIFGLNPMNLDNENQFILSQTELNAEFDENSSLQWWAKYSSKKIANINEEENTDISFDISASSIDESLTPFDVTGSLSTLYRDEKMFAKLHNFYIFMWEWNDEAKMYSLLSELLIDKRVDLETDSNPILKVSSDIPASEILWYLYTMLETPDIESEEATNFTFSLACVLDFINNHINLWFNPSDVKLVENRWVQYSTFNDWTIQKDFTWKFRCIDAEFYLSFSASQKWLEIHIYGIKLLDDGGNYMDLDDEIYFNIKEEKKSEYTFGFKLLEASETIADVKWNASIADNMLFSINFSLTPLELMANQEISWKLNWSFGKSISLNETLPDIPTDTLFFSELLSSFY